MSTPKKINCLKCVHFYVTWEKELPRACKAFGFKSKTMPSENVLQTTGRHCPVFKEKTKSQDEESENEGSWHA